MRDQNSIATAIKKTACGFAPKKRKQEQKTADGLEQKFP